MAAMPIDPNTMETSMPEATPESGMRTMQQPTQAANTISPKLPTPEPLPSEKSETQALPLLNSLQIGLVLLAIISGISAFLIRQINIQRWRKRL
jgi:hypothetical protein